MKFCAFLRGVNIGKSSLKMAEVVKVFESSGMKDVSAILATGNILFSSEKKPEDLKKILEKAMSEQFSYEAFMFVKTKDEVEEIFSKNPFEKLENAHIYAFIGVEKIDQILMENFKNSPKSENEKAQTINGNFYWQVEKGNTLDSAFGKILGRKDLKDQLTSRNINTFKKIVNKF